MASLGSVSLMLIGQLASAEYSQTTAVSNLALSVSAYCGSPKFNASYLQSWECGPSCTQAGSVSSITLFEDASKGIFGLTGKFDDHCLVLFRGTSSGDGWKTDLTSSQVDYTTQACSGGCQVEQGFNEGYLAVRPTILSSLQQYGCKQLRVTGHSLGAALSTIASYDLAFQYPIMSVYTFGTPRAGNKAFASAYNAKLSGVDQWRVTHDKDPIPHGPTLGMGYYHINNEAYYKNTTAEGYVTCPVAEDKKCADQFGGTFAKDIGLAACCASDHLDYMQNSVSYHTDGSSCTHVAIATAMQHANLATASYCDPEDLKRWDCGAPCDNVKGGVQDVQTLFAPFGPPELKSVVAGFVGHVQTDVGKRCVLSIRNLLHVEKGLEMMKNATEADLVEYVHPDCKGCKVYRPLLDALRAVRGPLDVALMKAGCSPEAESTEDRRLLITGHGLGASLGALLAFDLKTGTGYKKGSFGIEAGFHFGAPRGANAEFARAFTLQLGGDMFRVTHHQDPFVQLPSSDSGFVHLDQELFFNGDATWEPASYKRCPSDGESDECAQRYHGALGPVSEHVQYLQPLLSTEMSANACASKKSIVV